MPKDPLATGEDREPQPPPPLDPDSCCGAGCDPCVFDLHAQALERYREALRAWQARRGRSDEPSTGPWFGPDSALIRP